MHLMHEPSLFTVVKSLKLMTLELFPSFFQRFNYMDYLIIFPLAEVAILVRLSILTIHGK